MGGEGRDLRRDLQLAKRERGLTWNDVANELGYSRVTLRKYLKGHVIKLQTFEEDVMGWVDSDPVAAPVIAELEKLVERLQAENARMRAILEVYGFGETGLAIPECRNCARLTDRIERLVRENERLSPDQLRLYERV